MTIVCEHDVTGQVEPMKHLEKDLRSYLSRRDAIRLKAVKSFFTDNDIPLDATIDTDKAFIAVRWKVKRQHAADLQKTRNRRARNDFRQYAIHIVDLMQRITNHLNTEHNGVIWGKNLGKLYDEIAGALNEAANDVITAIDMAVDQQLLHRKEASDELDVEWVSVPKAA